MISAYPGDGGTWFGGDPIAVADQPFLPGMDQYGQFNTPWLQSALGDVLVSGPQAQIDPIWQKMQTDADFINASNYPYYVLGPNSNTVAHAIMQYAGLTSPPDENAIVEPGEQMDLLGRSLLDRDIDRIANAFGASRTEQDPLVIQISGISLSLTSLSSSSTEFDYSGSGLDEKTAWIGSGAGLLVLPSDSGQVENGLQLFGPTTGNGFTELSALDSNHDRIINSQDADWSQLKIWQDINGDGIAQPDELETLTQAGIASISLNYADTTQIIDGNSVVATSIVTFADGQTTTADEVDFAANLLNTSPDPNETTSANITGVIEALPFLKGYGELFDLDVAMSQDSTLVSDVTDLTSVAPADFADFDANTATLLYEWAGVANINPASRGDFDARQLETLENITGISWIHVGQENVGSYHPYVTAAWNMLYGSEELDLAVQTAFSVYLPGLSYVKADDSVEGFLDVQAAVSSIPTGAPTDQTGELFGLDGWMNFLALASTTPQLLVDLGGDSNELYAGAVSGLFGGYWVGSTSLPNFLQTDGSESFLYGNGWSGTIAAQSGAETIDTGNGNVTLSSPDGDKTIFTGTGTYAISLEGNQNVVSTGTGTTYITITSGTDSIVSGSYNTYLRSSGGSISDGSLFLDGGDLVYSSYDYNGMLYLRGDMQFSPNGGAYDNLMFMPETAGTFSITSVPTGDAANIFIDESGNDALTFDSTGTTYWVANNGSDTATIEAGTTEIFLGGSASDYTLAYDGVSTLTVTDVGDVDGTGTKAITLTAGLGELLFGDGSRVGLGSSQSGTTPDPVQYGTSGNDTFYVNGGTSFTDGGAGVDNVIFDGGTYIADSHWQVSENSLGQVVINGVNAGYDGTATLADVEQVNLGGTTYNLYATPAGGGGTSVTTGYALVTDGAGTDTLTFDSNSTSYWHAGAGAGATAATLTNGTTEIYLAGPQTDYTLAYDGVRTLTVTNTNDVDGTGTKTLTLAGGKGELVFGSGGNVALGAAQTNTTDTIQYGGTGAQVLNGTNGNDTIYLGRNNTAVGNGGNDTYLFGSGDGNGTVINNGGANTAASGQVDLLGNVTDQNLWFAQSGNNLLVDILGSTDQLTISNWCQGGANQVQQIDAGTLKIDSSIQTLVQAMATYATDNAGFNPQTSATTMPGDTTLQNTIAAAWHS